jgi:hypothetical protein
MAEEAVRISGRNGLDPRFIKNLKGKDFVLYNGLLDLGHQIGIQSILVEPIQYPTTDNGNEGICKATVMSADGRTFTEIGDANPKNVTAQISSHVLRMAATRAKARALRDMTNIGMTCLEELGDIDSITGSDDLKVIPMKKTKRSGNEKPDTTPEKTPDQHPEKTGRTNESNAPEKAADAKISSAQRNAIMSLAKRKGISEDALAKHVEEMFGVVIDALSASEASSFIRTLQTS